MSLRSRKTTLDTPDPPYPQFRKLWPIDQNLFKTHLIGLDADDRYMRFCGWVSESSIADYCDRTDWSRTTILGGFLEGELRGAAQLVRHGGPFAQTAEIALTVDKAFQNRGIGSTLLGRILTLARNRYIATVHMICLLENRKMQHIARKFDAHLVVAEGYVEGKISSPWPTMLSILEEATTDGQAFFRATFETAALAFPRATGRPTHVCGSTCSQKMWNMPPTMPSGQRPARKMANLTAKGSSSPFPASAASAA